jgi:hypothetical protein
MNLHGWVRVANRPEMGRHQNCVGQIVALRSSCIVRLEEVAPLATVKFGPTDMKEFSVTMLSETTRPA